MRETRSRHRCRHGRLALATAAVTALTACGSPAEEAGGEQAGEENGVEVLAGFYPLQFLAERVGGERVSVSSLLPPTVDPHNTELSPHAVVEIERADLVVHLAGFQPAVDDAVTQTGATAFDAAGPADLLTPAEQHDGGEDHTDDHDHGHGDDAHDDHDHGDDADDSHDGHDGHDGHDHGPEDPHFWLDPVRMADVAAALADTLVELDPDGAATYRENAATLATELDTLDAAYREGLDQCEQSTIVSSHEAYGYLTGRYDLTQEGLSGLDPEAEPSPARLAEIGTILEAEGVTTLFTEALVSPTVSEALAADLGVHTAVLDPLENQQDPGADYLEVMDGNLEVLREALSCS